MSNLYLWLQLLQRLIGFHTLDDGQWICEGVGKQYGVMYSILERILSLHIAGLSKNKS